MSMVVRVARRALGRFLVLGLERVMRERVKTRIVDYVGAVEIERELFRPRGLEEDNVAKHGSHEDQEQESDRFQEHPHALVGCDALDTGLDRDVRIRRQFVGAYQFSEIAPSEKVCVRFPGCVVAVGQLAGVGIVASGVHCIQNRHIVLFAKPIFDGGRLSLLWGGGVFVVGFVVFVPPAPGVYPLKLACFHD